MMQEKSPGNDIGNASNLDAFQAKIAYRFRDPELLLAALTHSSWTNECPGEKASHNERLEFLGDAVLEICVSDELYHRFPGIREGVLTRLRSKLVSEPSLAGIARQIGLGGLLRLGKGEAAQGGRERASILSDAFEAVLAAVYEDGGFSEARRVVDRLFEDHWPALAPGPERKDFKTALQEACHRRFNALPIYALLQASGPEHAKVFSVSLTMPDGAEFLASGTSCKRAEQKAAEVALEKLCTS